MFSLAPSIAAHGQSITLLFFALKSLASSSHVTYTISSHVTHHQLNIPILASKGILFSPVSSEGYLLISVHGPDDLRTRCNPPASETSQVELAFEMTNFTNFMLLPIFWRERISRRFHAGVKEFAIRIQNANREPSANTRNITRASKQQASYS